MMINHGDIVLAKIYFSGNKAYKFRPCLIVSNDEYKKNTLEVLVVPVSIKKFPQYSLRLESDKLIYGELEKESYVRCSGLFRLEQSSIVKKVAILEKKFLAQVIKRVRECF